MPPLVSKQEAYQKFLNKEGPVAPPLTKDEEERLERMELSNRCVTFIIDCLERFAASNVLVDLKMTIWANFMQGMTLDLIKTYTCIFLSGNGKHFIRLRHYYNEYLDAHGIKDAWKEAKEANEYTQNEMCQM